MWRTTIERRGTPCRTILHVWVEDARGRALQGFCREDFDVFEDSERREIAVFVEEKEGAATRPSIVIAVDASRSRASEASPIQQALWEFLPRIPRGAQLALLSFSDRTRLLSGFGTEIEAVRAAVERIQGDRGPVLYDALLQALSMLEATGNPHQFLVLVGGADDSGSRTSHRAVEYRMSAGGAAFFASGLLSRSGSMGPQTSVTTRWELTRLTSMTGGLAWFLHHPEDLGRSLVTIADRMRHHYLLEYYVSPSSNGPRFHRVEVRLKRGSSASRLNVRSRAGYYR